MGPRCVASTLNEFRDVEFDLCGDGTALPGLRQADSGAVTLIQRVGSAANLMVQPQYPRYASR